MFMALANVLFKDDVWDKGFVDKYVEPDGFNKWKNYVLGVEDGVEKAPEWTEEKCPVPAETIRALAKLLERVRLAWLWSHWAISPKSRGEQPFRAFASLQAMLGYWGIPGAGPPKQIGPCRPIRSEAP